MNKLDNLALDALEYLKDYCNAHDDCKKCIFYETHCGCILEGFESMNFAMDADEVLKKKGK